MAMLPTANGCFILTFQTNTIAHHAAAECFGVETPTDNPGGAPFVFDKDNPAESVIWVVTEAGRDMWRAKCAELRQNLEANVKGASQ